MVIRFKYKRGGQLKYLAHLDMMKLFERALKRADIRVEYSKGFNKRPVIVFGLPISLGMISVAEYADITLAGKLEPDEFKNKMNHVLPDRIIITAAAKRESKKNIMSTVMAAEYLIRPQELQLNDEEITDGITKLLSREEIVIEKMKKEKTIKKDIRKGIIRAEYGNDAIRLLLRSGQSGHIKPEEFVMALEIYEGIVIEVEEIVRLEIYIEDGDNKLKPPIEEY